MASTTIDYEYMKRTKFKSRTVSDVSQDEVCLRNQDSNPGGKNKSRHQAALPYGWKSTEEDLEMYSTQIEKEYQLPRASVLQNGDSGTEIVDGNIRRMEKADGETELQKREIKVGVHPIQESNSCENDDADCCGEIIFLRESEDEVAASPANTVECSDECELEKLDLTDELMIECDLISPASKPTFQKDDAKLELSDDLQDKTPAVKHQDSTPAAPSGELIFRDDDPVKVLKELEPNAVYKCEMSTLPCISTLHKGSRTKNLIEIQSRTTYTVSYDIHGHVFRGYSYFEEFARSSAARAALMYMHRCTFPVIAGMEDLIATLACDKVVELLDDYDLKTNVFSAVVMTTEEENQEPSDIKVVVVASGTKWVRLEHLSYVGETINDSHAEVLAMRALRAFLTGELEDLTASNGRSTTSIFEKCSNVDGCRPGVKENVDFHLLISKIPCGCTGFYSATEYDSRLHVKVEGQWPTVPIKLTCSLRSSNGKLRTMSCSDKLLKRIILGVQGAALSKLLGRVSLSSVLVSDKNKYDKGSLLGALFERCGDLSKGLQKHKPFISTFNIPERLKKAKISPAYGFFWIDDGGDVEKINQNKGTLEDGRISRLSKKATADRIWKLLTDGDDNNTALGKLTYHNLKVAAVPYQTMKGWLYKLLKDREYGEWVHDSHLLDQFSLVSVLEQCCKGRYL